MYPEAQCRFRAETSTIDMIFKLRQLQEKCHGQRKPLYIAFIDLTKAFDPVFRKGLSDLLQRIGCPHMLQRMIAFSVKEPSTTKAQPQTPSHSIAELNMAVYLLPRSSASFSRPTAVLRLQPLNSVYLHTGSDRNLFNLARLQVKTKVRKVLINEMLFANDSALTAHSEGALRAVLCKNQAKWEMKNFDLPSNFACN